LKLIFFFLQGSTTPTPFC